MRPIDLGEPPTMGDPVRCGPHPVDVAVSPRDPDVLFVVNGGRGTLTAQDAAARTGGPASAPRDAFGDRVARAVR